MSFEGKSVVITGGGSGIGRATAKLIAQEGALVVIGNRSRERGEQVIAEITADGGQAIFKQTDVTDADQVQALIKFAVQEYGHLDYAFNNSGYEGVSARVHEQTLEEFHKVINTNLNGIFYAMKYELEQMMEQGHGAIVNNASTLGVKGVAQFSPYVTSKHAINGLTKSAALDYATKNIRINAVAPGPIETRMLTDIGGGDATNFDPLTPMKRIGAPEEVANTVLWLLSEKSSYQTGLIVPVDGGWLAM